MSEVTAGAVPAPAPPVVDSLDTRLARGFGWLLIAIIIWGSRLLLPLPPAPPELDPSWQQGLSYALAHHFQFGREILFTFGPLGGMAHGRFQPELYWIQLLGFEFLFKGLLVWRWIAAMRRWPTALDKVVFVLMLVISELGADAFYFATTVMLASLQLDDEKPSRRRLALDLFLLAVIAFIKFTYFLLVGGVVAMVVARFALRSRREGLVTLGIYAGCVLAVWSLCGQAPWNLPIYLVRSLAIASGYSEAQAYDGPLSEVFLGVWWIVLLIAISLATAIGSARRTERLLAALVVIGGAYVAFKASFTYHSASCITFFGYASLALCALLPPSDASSGRRVLLGFARAASAVLCVVGLSMRYSSWEEMLGHTFGEGTQGLLRTEKALAKLPELEETLEQQSQRRSLMYDLPRTREIVGQSEIDLVGSTQSWIFQNGLNWKPRPLFQTYIVVAPSLIALNERFLSGPDAPEFVLLDIGTIDNRVSGMEDCGSMRALLHCYRPVALEHRLVLLRRDPALAARPPPRVEVLDERSIRPDEVVRLGQFAGKALRVRFDIRYNLLGKLRKLFYHAPIATIQLQCNDGQKMRCRLMPDMVRSGLMLRPFVQSNEEWARLYTRGVEKRVQSFSVQSGSAWDSFYQPEIKIVIERVDDLLPEPSLETELDLAFGSFNKRPTYASTSTEFRNFLIGRGDVVLAGPDSRISFELSPGPHKLSGACGMLRQSLGLSDGVDFSVAVVSKDGRRPLLQETLVPRGENDLYKPVELEFESQPGDRLVLATGNPPERNIDFDLAYWHAIKLD